MTICQARLWVTAALVALSAVAAATIVNAAPEHARLTAMCGTWDVEMTFWFQPGRPPVTTGGTSTIRPLLGGLFVEEQIDGTLNGAPFTTLAWTGFNTTTHQYEATRIASTNTIRVVESGGYDEATKQFELKADYPMAGDTVAPAHGDSNDFDRRHDCGQLSEFRHRARVEGRGNQVQAQGPIIGA